MKKSTPLTLLVLVVVAAIAVFIVAKDMRLSTAADATKYCSPDGTLSDEQSIQSHRSYCLKSNTSDIPLVRNKPSTFAFTIVDDRGEIAKDFVIAYAKPAHVIVVRDDLQHFQHVHPEFNETTGLFTLDGLTFPANGVYRIFVNFVPDGAMTDSSGKPLAVTISEDVKVGGRYVPQPLGSEERLKTFGDQQVMFTANEPLQAGVETTISYHLVENGRPVTDLEKYLRVLGHGVILREHSLDFIHVHPIEYLGSRQDGYVDFVVTFPEAGNYKIFTQFQRDGEVFTTDYIVSVAEAEL